MPTFTWEQFAAMPPDDQPIGAYYTVRRWRPDVHELDMLFVLHGDEDGGTTAGPAAPWAAARPTGRPGRAVGSAHRVRTAAGTEWYLLVADDTGLPGVAAIIESLPAGTPIEVVAEVDAEEDRQPLPRPTVST